MCLAINIAINSQIKDRLIYIGVENYAPRSALSASGSQSLTVPAARG
jgi:hypothetical protein